MDSLLKKHYDFSPYNYVLNNPLNKIDKDGKQDDFPLIPLFDIFKEIIKDPKIVDKNRESQKFHRDDPYDPRNIWEGTKEDQEKYLEQRLERINQILNTRRKPKI